MHVGSGYVCYWYLIKLPNGCYGYGLTETSTKADHTTSQGKVLAHGKMLYCLPDKCSQQPVFLPSIFTGAIHEEKRKLEYGWLLTWECSATMHIFWPLARMPPTFDRRSISSVYTVCTCVSASVYLCICVSLHLCVYASVCLCICLSLHLCICAPVCLCVCAPLQLCICVSVHLCVCICVSVHLCICASVCLCIFSLLAVYKVYMSVCLCFGVFELHCICLCVFVFVCLNYMSVCMHVCVFELYVCLYVCVHVYPYVGMSVCLCILCDVFNSCDKLSHRWSRGRHTIAPSER